MWGFAVALLAVVMLWPYPRARLEASAAALQSVRVTDRQGRPLYEAPSEHGGFGQWVALEDISPWLVAATLSAEDANFRRHLGVDPTGIARALWLNARAGRVAYGGSTITQQLAKLLDREPRTVLGKLLEARDALRLELALSKDEILEQYLNRAYYGRLASGVEAASRRFFGKRARELTLDEAALLAILPRAPSAYDPERFPERARQRRAHVLNKLAERGWVDAEAARIAAEKPIALAPLPPPKARHVLDALPRAALREHATAGSVRTTIDLELSERLERRLRRHLDDLTRADVDQAALVVLDNASGDVLALLGSRDYEERRAHGAVNAAFAPRAPGSTLKPFVYALAVERGHNPGSPAFDVPTRFRDFQPRNASAEFAGLVSLRTALGSSLNVPAVRLAEEVGVGALARLLVDAGLARDAAALEAHGLALALGSARVRLIDLANAYATLARGGEHRPFRLLHPERAPEPSRRVLDAATAFLVTDMLSDASARRLQFGVETPLELPFPVAVKTGTSKSFCDNVVVGYTPEITVAVWVGNFDGRPMQRLLAMQGAAPLFREAMSVAMENRPRRRFDAPESVETMEVCALSGLARGAACPTGRREPVSKRHRPGACDWHGPDGTLRVPAELAAFMGASREDGAPKVLSSAGAPVAIASPADGARVALDGVVPRARQKLPLRALVRDAAVTRVRWEIDGVAVAEVGPPFSAEWAIEPGRHRVRAVALAEPKTTPIAADAVELEVSGGT